MDRKYSSVNLRICYQKERSGLFKYTPAKNYDMLIYEENGKYFELLTGKFLGTSNKGKNTYRHYIFSDEFGEIICLGYSSYGLKTNCISTEEFANKAKIYMEDKNEIIPLINKKFDEWREAYRKKLEQENLKTHSEKEAENWLNNLLENR